MYSNEQQQSDDVLVYDGGKKARIFVVDYGERMFSEGEWRLRLALRAVRDQINKICCTGDLNEMCAVIFANTANSKNTHNIDCIFTDREMGVVDAEYVKSLDSLLSKENLKEMLMPMLGDSGGSNWAELLFLCQSAITHSGYVLRRKVITIFTTDADRVDLDVQKAVKNRFTKDLTRIGAEIKVFLTEKETDEAETTQFWKFMDPSLSRFSSFDDISKSLFFKNYSLRSTTTLPFVLANELEFAVGLYHLVKPQKKPSAILMDSETNERVECKTHFIPKDDNEFRVLYSDSASARGEGSEEVAKNVQEITNEYFEGEVDFSKDVGGVQVILDRSELEKLRRFDRPSITVIGFKTMHLLKASHRMSPAKYIYPLDDVISGSSAIYRALLRRCIDRKLLILVRFTQKPNTPPQICVLVPQSAIGGNEGNNSISEHLYEGFHLLELPFTEEARNLRASARYKRPKSDEGVWPSANAEQLAAAREFVSKLTTRFEPDQFFNPALQRHYKTVESVALDLDVENFAEEAESLDKLQPYFKIPTYVQRVAANVAKLEESCKAQL